MGLFWECVKYLEDSNHLTSVDCCYYYHDLRPQSPGYLTGSKPGSVKRCVTASFTESLSPFQMKFQVQMVSICLFRCWREQNRDCSIQSGTLEDKPEINVIKNKIRTMQKLLRTFALFCFMQDSQHVCHWAFVHFMDLEILNFGVMLLVNLKLYVAKIRT